jgi:hypothetical protein
MGEAKEKKRLDAYVDEFEDENEGMGLIIENHEGGGSQCPDESSEFESRLEWLRHNNGTHSDSIWRKLAKGEAGAKKVPDDKELVYLKMPGWFVNDDDDLKKLFQNTHDGETVTVLGVIRVESSEDANAYAFSKFKVPRTGWTNPRNQYKTAWVPKKICTLYRRVGDPRPLDKERINERQALPEEVDRFEADSDDYDWRLALGAAYRRSEGREDNPVEEAYEEAQDLPKKLYEKVEIGVDEYMRQAAADNREVGEAELAMVIKSLTKALTPGVSNEYED